MTTNNSLTTLQDRLKKVVGSRLATAREDLHYSQSDVLEELEKHGIGRTQGSLSQIEKGHRLPSLEMFYVLLHFYQASADYTLGLNEEAVSPFDHEEGGKALDIGAIINQLPEVDRENLITYGEFLLARHKKIVLTDNPPMKRKTKKPSVAAQAEDNQKAFSAVLAVMKRRLSPDELDEAIDEMLKDAPELKGMIEASRTSPKGKGLGSR